MYNNNLCTHIKVATMYMIYMDVHGRVLTISLLSHVGYDIRTFHPEPCSSRQPDSKHYVCAKATTQEP